MMYVQFMVYHDYRSKTQYPLVHVCIYLLQNYQMITKSLHLLILNLQNSTPTPIIKIKSNKCWNVSDLLFPCISKVHKHISAGCLEAFFLTSVNQYQLYCHKVNPNNHYQFFIAFIDHTYSIYQVFSPAVKNNN